MLGEALMFRNRLLFGLLIIALLAMVLLPALVAASAPAGVDVVIKDTPTATPGDKPLLPTPKPQLKVTPTGTPKPLLPTPTTSGSK
jgi:hypothetical protein